MNLPENNNTAYDGSEFNEEWLSAYIDDELTDAQRILVEQRLVSDSEARQLLSDLQRVRGLVHQLPSWTGKRLGPTGTTEQSDMPIASAMSVTRGEFLGEGNDASGDYHEELKPNSAEATDAGSALQSDSIAENLDPDYDSPEVAERIYQDPSNETVHLLRSASTVKPHAQAWLWPLALTTCLLLAVGGSAWLWSSGLWNFGSPWTVATSNSSRDLDNQLESANDEPAGTMADEFPEGLAFDLDAHDRHSRPGNTQVASDQLQPPASSVAQPVAPKEAIEALNIARETAARSDGGSNLLAEKNSALDDSPPPPSPAVAAAPAQTTVVPESMAATPMFKSEELARDEESKRADAVTSKTKDFGDQNRSTLEPTPALPSEAISPKVQAPKVQAPKVQAPEVQALEVQALEANLPELNRSKARLPEREQTEDKAIDAQPPALPLPPANTSRYDQAGAADRGTSRESTTPAAPAPSSASGLQLKFEPAGVVPPSSSRSVQLKMAHSGGWSQNEIEIAVQRLAPLLKLPATRSNDPAVVSSAAAIPVALVSQKPPTAQQKPLVDVLQRQSIQLQEVVAADSLPFAWQAPFAQATDSSSSSSEKPSTVALFVLRDEAEQILQAADQAGSLAANPIWITSAAGTPAVATPKQQVVLLFSPQ